MIADDEAKGRHRGDEIIPLVLASVIYVRVVKMGDRSSAEDDLLPVASTYSLERMNE